MMENKKLRYKGTEIFIFWKHNANANANGWRGPHITFVHVQFATGDPFGAQKPVSREKLGVIKTSLWIVWKMVGIAGCAD